MGARGGQGVEHKKIDIFFGYEYMEKMKNQTHEQRGEDCVINEGWGGKWDLIWELTNYALSIVPMTSELVPPRPQSLHVTLSLQKSTQVKDFLKKACVRSVFLHLLYSRQIIPLPAEEIFCSWAATTVILYSFLWNSLYDNYVFWNKRYYLTLQIRR